MKQNKTTRRTTVIIKKELKQNKSTKKTKVIITEEIKIKQQNQLLLKMKQGSCTV